MILGKDEENLIITIDSTDYKLLDSSDYEQILIYLSNPMTEIDNLISIDDSITDEEERKKLEVYKVFIEKFIAKRKELDEQISSEEDSNDEDTTEITDSFNNELNSDELPF